MLESIQAIANNAIGTLLAALIATATGKLMSSTKISAIDTKAAAQKTTSEIFKYLLTAAPYVFCFWFFFWQLQTLLAPEGPASRVDTFMISFWTFWVCVMYLRLLAGKPLALGSKSD